MTTARLEALAASSAPVPDMDGPPMFELVCLKTRAVCVLGARPWCPAQALQVGFYGETPEEPYQEPMPACRRASPYREWGVAELTADGCVRFGESVEPPVAVRAPALRGP